MEEIDREQSVHGGSWDGFHGGYFSDPAITHPLVRRILGAAADSRARIVVDLGGAGYVLSQLHAAGWVPCLRLRKHVESPR